MYLSVRKSNFVVSPSIGSSTEKRCFGELILSQIRSFSSSSFALSANDYRLRPHIAKFQLGIKEKNKDSRIWSLKTVYGSQ